jgi:hypothetical protein
MSAANPSGAYVSAKLLSPACHEVMRSDICSILACDDDTAPSTCTMGRPIIQGRRNDDGRNEEQGQRRAGEPDPAAFERFCRAMVPGCLTEVCHVDAKLAGRVGEDILARGESYAALDESARDVLIAPFIEEVVDYEPPDAPLSLKGAVAVVVRNSLLEDAHALGPVEAGGITGITSMGCGTVVTSLGRSVPKAGKDEAQHLRGSGRHLPTGLGMSRSRSPFLPGRRRPVPVSCSAGASPGVARCRSRGTEWGRP